jgi:hypothetical protein
MQVGSWPSPLFLEIWRRRDSKVVRFTGAVLSAALLLVFTGCGGAHANLPPAPRAAFSPANLDFGAQKEGTSSTQTVTVTNAGTAALSISGITLGGTDAAAFTMGSNTCSANISLNPGADCTVSITFTPSATSSQSANLGISDNTSNSPQSVGLSGIGFSLSGIAHGLFMVDPPTDDTSCADGFPSGCYSQHLVPTFICAGAGTPAGYNCGQTGAGHDDIEGAAFHVSWASMSSGNGSFDFSQADHWIQPWSDAGKLVGLIFEPASFGSNNKGTPSWYLATVPITSASQTNGIIKVQTATGMNFIPGSIGAAAGLEIQIRGTGTALDGNGTPASPGIWTICDHTTSGCQDPTSTTIYALGPGGSTAAVGQGTVGNPVYGSDDGSTCTSGILPIQWRPNFIQAWKNVISSAVSHYAGNNNVAYLRFGMGIGGQTNPTYGLSASDANQVACQKQMTLYGFTSSSVTSPWPDPDTSQWTSEVSPTWVAYLKNMVDYEHGLSSPKAIVVTMSAIQFGPDDLSTPDATAKNAAAVGIGLGNQGLQKDDPTNFGSGKACAGGDWCANFQTYHSPSLPFELQTLSVSDPTNNSQTGSLGVLLPFATTHWARILELYVDDWMCTYDSSWNGNNTYSACTNAGYPAVMSTAAAQIN